MKLSDEQLLASCSRAPRIAIEAVPGSGKTEVAAVRFGHLCNKRTKDARGVLGVAFTRSSASELRSRVAHLWGGRCLGRPNVISTIDEAHVSLFRELIREGVVRPPWPPGALEVVDSYQALTPCSAYRPYSRVIPWRASLGDCGEIRAERAPVASGTWTPQTGEGLDAILQRGQISHDDVRGVIEAAKQLPEMEDVAEGWLGRRYREVILDEAYDANALDLWLIDLAMRGDLGVTLVGDQWQAIYEWRGAQPDMVRELVLSPGNGFQTRPLHESYRFKTSLTADLAARLRAGEGIDSLPVLGPGSAEVVLGLRWSDLWGAPAGLPAAWGPSESAPPAAALVLDAATRAQFGERAQGARPAELRLGQVEGAANAQCDDAFTELVGRAADGVERALHCLGQLPLSLPDAALTPDGLLAGYLTRLRERWTNVSRVPAMTVHQSKGRQWSRVGLALPEQALSRLADGLRVDDEEDRKLYVALTRASHECGLIEPVTS